jgi:transposase
MEGKEIQYNEEQKTGNEWFKMNSLDEIINGSRDAREVKRALSVKMVENGWSPATVSELLNVSEPYISKWKGKYETLGAAGLRLGYVGSEGYLTDEQRAAVVAWIGEHETLTVEEVRDYVEATYEVVYQSKQSYYDLLSAGGMSYHQSEKQNPKHDEAQVQARREEIKKNWRRDGRPSNAARSSS